MKACASEASSSWLLRSRTAVLHVRFSVEIAAKDGSVPRSWMDAGKNRCQCGASRVVAFMAARVGDAAAEQQRPGRAVEQHLAGHQRAEYARLRAAHIGHLLHA